MEENVPLGYVAHATILSDEDAGDSHFWDFVVTENGVTSYTTDLPDLGFALNSLGEITTTRWFDFELETFRSYYMTVRVQDSG